MKFLYRGILENGESIDGELDASNRKQALNILSQKNICVLELQEKQDAKESRSFWKTHIRGNTCLSLEDSVRFFEKLYDLLNAQLTLTDAIISIIKNTSNVQERRLLQNVLQELQEGTSLSEALKKFCNSLSSNILCILNIGDVTGNLPHAVLNVVKILHRKIELKKHLATALSYPLLICVISLCVIGLFMFYLVPSVENMMYNLGGQLPLATRLLITGSHWIVRDSWMMLLVLVVFFIIYRILYQRPNLRLLADHMKLKIPITGKLEMLYLQVTITNMLSGLLSSGIDIALAMKMPVDAVGNDFFKQQYKEAQASILDGVSVSHALQKFGIIDGSVCDILAVGEKTGHLDDAFSSVAIICENRLDNFLKKLITCISVIALLFAFSLVAILTLSIVSSVLNFSSSLAR